MQLVRNFQDVKRMIKNAIRGILKVLPQRKKNPGAPVQWLRSGTYVLNYLKHLLAGESRLLVPLLIVLSLLFMLYGSGQLVSLSRAFTAGWNLSVDRPEIELLGYRTGINSVLLWWASSSSTVMVLSLFLRRKTSPASTAYQQAEEISQRILIFIIAHMLILAPLFLHPQVTAWMPSPVLSLITVSGILVFMPSFSSLRKVAIFLSWLIVVQSLALHALPTWGVGIGTAGVLARQLYLMGTNAGSMKHRLFLAVLFMSAMGFCAVATISLKSVVRIRYPGDHGFDYHALLVSAWWFLPSLVATITTNFPRPLWSFKSLLLAAVLWIVPLSVAAIWPDRVSALCTMCFATGLILTVAKVLQLRVSRIWRRVIFVLGMFNVIYSAYRLEPTLDLKQKAPEVAVSSRPRSSAFREFLADWTKARGETPGDHGPMLLLAASGGGLRAAAHAGLSFTAADDFTNGKFGQRVFAVSGVSGGALGTVSWLGAHNDGSQRDTVTKENFEGNTARVLKLGEFYSNDFVSPLANSLLTHDIPLGLVPFLSWTSHRADTLTEAWRQRWTAVLPKGSIEWPDQAVFDHTVLDFSAEKGRLPMVIINATAANDGRRAIYSSVNAKFSGAWHLDATRSVGSAVADSARFAFISPLGQSCTDVKPDAPVVGDMASPCHAGYYPITIADGGYADNSGLASINDVLSELKAEGDNLEKVYVIIVKSNPSEGLPFREGTRFDNGRLLSELVGPGYVLDSARSGHTATFEALIRERLLPAHVITWQLSNVDLVEGFRPGPTNAGSWLDRVEQFNSDTQRVRSLNLPPLGWTLDRASFRGIYSAAMRTWWLASYRGCDARNSDDKKLCEDLANSHSVIRE